MSCSKAHGIHPEAHLLDKRRDEDINKATENLVNYGSELTSTCKEDAVIVLKAAFKALKYTGPNICAFGVVLRQLCALMENNCSLKDEFFGEKVSKAFYQTLQEVANLKGLDVNSSKYKDAMKKFTDKIETTYNEIIPISLSKKEARVYNLQSDGSKKVICILSDAQIRAINTIASTWGVCSKKAMQEANSDKQKKRKKTQAEKPNKQQRLTETWARDMCPEFDAMLNAM